MIRLPLGLQLSPNLTMQGFIARARERLALVQLGRSELAYMAELSFVDGCGFNIIDGELHLLVPIQEVLQQTFHAHRGRGRRRNMLGALARGDDVRLAHVQQAINLIQRNAEIVERVGVAMNIEADLPLALGRIERQEGVRVRAAQRFHHRNQGVLIVDVDGEEILFRPMPVRTGIADTIAEDLDIKLAAPTQSYANLQASVAPRTADLLGEGNFWARPREFRVGDLDPWHRIVLEGARVLGIPLSVSAKEVTSTWSLRQTVTDIQRVTNWPQLVDEVIKALVAAKVSLAEKPQERA